VIGLTLQFSIGVLLLSKAADWFARAVAGIARETHMPRYAVGAVLVGFVTNVSALTVSVTAALSGKPGLSLGNAVGSIIFDTGLTLGLCLWLTRVPVQTPWLRDHGFPMILAGIAFYFFTVITDLTRFTALLLLILLALYLAWSLAASRREPELAREAEELAAAALQHAPGARHRWAALVLLVSVSLPILVLSGQWVLSSAIEMARSLGVSDAVIGLTLLATGTSIPTLVAALAASRQGHLDTAVGMILGANIYTLLGVIGVSALAKPLPVTAANRLFDFPVMLLLLIIPLFPLMVGRQPGRLTGGLLLLVFAAYEYSLFVLRGVFDP